jgi:hypothetical protein
VLDHFYTYKKFYQFLFFIGVTKDRFNGNRPLEPKPVKESNTRWCSDGLVLTCDNGERVRVAFALDCYD